MKVIARLLYPFSLLYGGVMRVRNTLYDQNFLKSNHFTVPVISIGNLTVGGTGKTPHVEYLLRLLNHKKTATLSRGYKRKIKGYILADASASAESLGDEPYQYYLDYPQVTVAVSEDRALGIKNLLDQKPDLDVIVLDDAFQHRGVTPSLNILLTDYARLFYQDLVLPAGRLREFPAGANRADVIIVTKCPEFIANAEMQKIKKLAVSYAQKEIPVFFTRYQYGNLVPCIAKQPVSNQILVITAIANAKPLIGYLQDQGYQVLHHYQFPDHHAFTKSDLKKIFADWQRYSQNNPVTIITTRKDAVKLANLITAPNWQNVPLFYLPIKVAFIKDQEDFDALILNHIANQSKPENN
ncbi:tetraacyldisaccharide 4'-kinase [Adhaeribacter swui]|uniref:Tetraacyldisaccharide 4'-kinase n=1 Tax=Adhaeribacter swui TaxID=2086471 RepID=A0A7G7GDK5_9BACT|nr:tetraacyldisaccharide 4'-kinase [Adhaeribacter swui]QNF35239.1 tetraacyldisaccharide 4'-kinase [Adhaeribacter swui]